MRLCSSSCAHLALFLAAYREGPAAHARRLRGAAALDGDSGELAAVTVVHQRNSQRPAVLGLGLPPTYVRVTWQACATSQRFVHETLPRPLCSAYVSLAWGRVAEQLHPEMVELETSRGVEDPMTVAFMRVSVLATEVLFVLVVVSLVCVLRRPPHTLPDLALLLAALAHPPLLLIDHGHFQYNGVCIGLVLLWVLGVAAACRSPATALPTTAECGAAAAFMLALNFKQMALYYALPVFALHVGRAWRAAAAAPSRCEAVARFLAHIAVLGCVVLTVQAAMLAPLCAAAGDCAAQAHAVGRRVFPFARGLFEDKVANLWCALDPVLRLRGALLSGQVQLHSVLALASGVTLAGALPAMWAAAVSGGSPEQLLRACSHGSLAFFLASYQVHEKSILLPSTLAAVADAMSGRLRPSRSSALLQWTALLSMGPLLCRDRLQVPLCVGGVALAALLVWAWAGAPRWQRGAVAVAACAQVLLLAASAALRPPQRYPDLFPVLLAMLSCSMFVAVWVMGTARALGSGPSSKLKEQ